MYPDKAQLYEKGTGGSIVNEKWVASDDVNPVWTGRGDMQDASEGRRRDREGDAGQAYSNEFFFDELNHPMDVIKNDMVLQVAGRRYRIVSIQRDNKAANITPV